MKYGKRAVFRRSIMFPQGKMFSSGGNDMRLSGKIISIVSAAAILGMLAGPVMAGTESKSGDQDGSPDRDRAKDGSCQELILANTLLILAGTESKSGDQDGSPDRDRAKDGSCTT